jgi:hypothetical protein
MPIYRLDPINPSDLRWRTHSAIQGCVWVEADSPDEARSLVAARAIMTHTSARLFASKLRSPWLDDRQVSCTMVPSRTDVPKGSVIRADGSHV